MTSAEIAKYRKMMIFGDVIKIFKIFFLKKLDIDEMDVWSKFGADWQHTFGDIKFLRFMTSSNHYVMIYIFFNN